MGTGTCEGVSGAFGPGRGFLSFDLRRPPGTRPAGCVLALSLPDLDRVHGDHVERIGDAHGHPGTEADAASVDITVVGGVFNEPRPLDEGVDE